MKTASQSSSVLKFCFVAVGDLLILRNNESIELMIAFQVPDTAILHLWYRCSGKPTSAGETPPTHVLLRRAVRRLTRPPQKAACGAGAQAWSGEHYLGDTRWAVTIFSRCSSSGVTANSVLCSVRSATSSQAPATRSKCARRTGVAVCASRRHSSAYWRYPATLGIYAPHANYEVGASCRDKWASFRRHQTGGGFSQSVAQLTHRHSVPASRKGSQASTERFDQPGQTAIGAALPG